MLSMRKSVVWSICVGGVRFEFFIFVSYFCVFFWKFKDNRKGREYEVLVEDIVKIF